MILNQMNILNIAFFEPICIRIKIIFFKINLKIVAAIRDITCTSKFFCMSPASVKSNRLSKSYLHQSPRLSVAPNPSIKFSGFIHIRYCQHRPFNFTLIASINSDWMFFFHILSLYGFYLIISNIAAMSSVAIVTFDFSIKMFPPVII